MCVGRGDLTAAPQVLPPADEAQTMTLRVEDLHRRFGATTVLDGVELRVPRGEVVGIVGPNGAGKTTLLRIAAGLLSPSAGRVRVAGRIPERARREGRIGWCGEDGLQRRLPLGANLLFAGRLAGLGDRDLRRRIDALAEWLELGSTLSRPAERCSTGQRRRAAVARALLADPELLLLDEPLRGVDDESAARLVLELRARCRQAAVLWVSHDPEQLVRVADRRVRLRNGRLDEVERGRRAA